MERTREAHQKWNHARCLVVQAANSLTLNFEDTNARAELKSAVKAEKKARAEFERAMRAEKHDGHGNFPDGKDGQA